MDYDSTDPHKKVFHMKVVREMIDDDISTCGSYECLVEDYTRTRALQKFLNRTGWTNIKSIEVSCPEFIK